jgi:Tfp pilus assembly protein PilP
MRISALSLAAVVLAGTVSVYAQAPRPSPTPAPAAAPEADKPIESELTAPVYTYEIGGRRDPFRSLLLRNPNEKVGERPPGLPGMGVEELELQGTIKTAQGWVAMMRGSDNRSYLLKKGTTVFDGEVTDITATEVTFRQNVNDPTNPKPFRDVVKALNLTRSKQ